MQNGKLRERLVTLMEELREEPEAIGRIMDDMHSILNKIEDAFIYIAEEIDDIRIDNLDAICSARDKAEEIAKELY